jgi:hypothetical protein
MVPSVNAHHRAVGAGLLTIATMAAPDVHETPEDFAGRLALAIQVSGKSPTRTGRESGLDSGYIFKLLGVSKAKQILSPGPEVIRQLADYLEVSYEWLAVGRGPMRAEGWAASPLEEAMLFAKKHGARADAIASAAERFRDAGDMTAIDWVMAFDAEARRLDRVGAPRPEVVAKRQGQFRRAVAKKRRADQVAQDERAAERARAGARRGGAA